LHLNFSSVQNFRVTIAAGKHDYRHIPYPSGDGSLYLDHTVLTKDEKPETSCDAYRNPSQTANTELVVSVRSKHVLCCLLRTRVAHRLHRLHRLNRLYVPRIS